MSLREQFKATAMSDLNNQQKEFDAVFDSEGSYLSLEVGKNKIRIFPKHPGTASFIYPKGVHFLPIQVEEDGKKVVKNKPVWSGLYHSEHKKCIIDEYISQVWLLSKSITDKKQREEFVGRLTAFKSGIGMSRTWVVYANLIKGTSKKFGILELKTSVKNAMNALASNMDDGSSMITTDPYTDPDTGICIYVTYDNKPVSGKAEDYYKTGPDIMGPTKLTDAELDILEKAKSLEDIYTNCYRRSDFLLALEGLKRFDEAEEDYNIFSTDHWAEIVEQYSDLYPEEEQIKEATESSTKIVGESSPAKEKSLESIRVGVEKKAESTEITAKKKYVSDMNRAELIQHIKVQGFPIRVLPEDTVEEIRSLVQREVKLMGTLPFKEEDDRDLKEQTREESIPDNPLEFLKKQVG